MKGGNENQIGITGLELQSEIGNKYEKRYLQMKAEINDSFLKEESQRVLAFEYFKELAKNTFEKVRNPVANLDEDGTPNLDPHSYEQECI